jgi:hypothetical protein
MTGFGVASVVSAYLTFSALWRFCVNELPEFGPAVPMWSSGSSEGDEPRQSHAEPAKLAKTALLTWTVHPCETVPREIAKTRNRSLTFSCALAFLRE